MRSDSKEFLNKHQFIIEIYITYLLQILSFFSRFTRFEMQNFLRRSTMVDDNISQFVAPPEFFHFYGPVATQNKTFDNFSRKLKKTPKKQHLNFP